MAQHNPRRAQQRLIRNSIIIIIILSVAISLISKIARAALGAM